MTSRNRLSRELLRRSRRMVVIALVTMAAVYVAAAALMFFAQTSIIFPRSATGPTSPRPPASPVRVMWIDIGEGERVEAWFIPGRGRSAAQPGPAVLFAHGNATLIDHALPTASFYSERGISVMMVEYRGYGLSGGTPSQRGIVADFVEAYDRLVAEPEVAGSAVIGHGRSLGGGVMAQVSAQRPMAALIIESSFTSVVVMARRSYMPGFICRHPFRTDRALASFDNPVLLIHGTQDTIVPVEHSRTLAGLTPRATLIEMSCGHNDLSIQREYREHLSVFLDQLGLSGGASD